MLFALEQESEESMVRLEKANILEVTVRHLRKLKAANSLCLTPSATYAQRFRSGFSTCAAEAQKFITSPASGFEPHAATAIINHLSLSLQQLASVPPSRLSARESSKSFSATTQDLDSEESDYDDVDQPPLDFSRSDN
jgi:hypothetical protein